VFESQRRPWIELARASTETTVQAVEACPSGALTYERLDGGPQEIPDTPTSIVPWPNGPLMVRGRVSLRDRHGGGFDSGPRMTLCRCGASDNQPFCDLTHKESGFRDYPRANQADRDRAECPGDISDAPLD
jgi:CDGSH-type Zn-finger protein